MKESYTFALLCVGLLFFATQGCSSGAESEAVAAPRVSGASQVFPVTLAVARRAPIKRTVHFVGTMEAGAEAGVAAEVDGRLLSVDADLGDEVVSGQVLATLDGAALAARLREAETLLVRAQSELDRASRLGSEGVISEQKLDDLASQRDVAVARRDVLAIELAHTRVRAPFTGRIAKRLADAGSYVRRGTALFDLVSDNPLRLRGEVPERYTARIEEGQEVEAEVVAYPDLVIRGRLTRISAVADARSRALTVEVRVPNHEGLLKPGFFTKADIVTRLDEGVVIPAEAVIRMAGVKRVFVVDDQGVARSRLVRTGIPLGPDLEIVEGLEPGERVATSGMARLFEGATVSVRQAWEGGVPGAGSSS